MRASCREKGLGLGLGKGGIGGGVLGVRLDKGECAGELEFGLVRSLALSARRVVKDHHGRV